MVHATVDSVITLPKDGIAVNILDEIRGALLMENPLRANAKREKIGGWWNMDEYNQLYSEDDENLIIPRGFANQLVEGFNHYGLEVQFDDRRSHSRVQGSFSPVDVRDYQKSAIDSILSCEQGVWESPPGSGKTVAILECIRRAGQKAIVVVDKTNIAEQWRERAANFLNCDIGIIGDGKYELNDISVALQQTLWSKKDQLLEEGFFDLWGFVCLDECHHLPANTFTEILSLFPAKYRIGVSGTPYKKTGMEDLVFNTLGPRIHKTEKAQLVKDGWLIKPEVHIWQTDFKFDFWPTHNHTPTKKKPKCMYLYCSRDQEKKRHQNNYSEMMTALVENHPRNMLIAKNIAKELKEGHTIVVLSKRIKHLDELARLTGSLVGSTDNLYQFTGKQTTKERMEIVERADKGSCVLFSTIADEALDIPRISRIHLAWPTANTGTIEQQVGREERPHKDKHDAKVNDYWDKIGPMTRQLRNRVNEVYLPQALSITGDSYE